MLKADKKYQSEIDMLERIKAHLESEKPVKTFSFGYNEDYTTPIIGMGIYGGAKLERMETFIGYDQTTANNYCLNHNLTCSFEYRESYEEYGTIIDQDVHEGELLKSVSSCTFYLSDGKGVDPNAPVEPENPENPDNPENPENPENPQEQENP